MREINPISALEASVFEVSAATAAHLVKGGFPLEYGIDALYVRPKRGESETSFSPTLKTNVVKVPIVAAMKHAEAYRTPEHGIVAIQGLTERRRREISRVLFI